MADKETNQYKAALHAALGVIDEQIALVSGDQGMVQPVVSRIATQDGWVCDAADEWVSELSERCTPIATEFQAARDEVHGEWSGEPDEVDANDWRGNRYSAHGRVNPGVI